MWWWKRRNNGKFEIILDESQPDLIERAKDYSDKALRDTAFEYRNSTEKKNQVEWIEDILAERDRWWKHWEPWTFIVGSLTLLATLLGLLAVYR